MPILLVLLILIGISGCASPQETLFAESLAKANEGNMVAQYRVGQMYATGTGIELNHEQSFYWTNLSAQQGWTDAQYALGFAYLVGRGVAADVEEAVKWLTLAANEGDSNAAGLLAVIYLGDRFFDPDLQKGIEWLIIAAQSGNSDSQAILGNAHRLGVGVSKNDGEAFRLFALSANVGNPLGQYLLGLAFKLGIGTEISVQEAEKYFRLSAETGSGRAQWELGLLLKNRQQDQNIEDSEADKWLSLVEEQGLEYDSGLYMPQDIFFERFERLHELKPLSQEELRIAIADGSCATLNTIHIKARTGATVTEDMKNGSQELVRVITALGGDSYSLDRFAWYETILAGTQLNIYATALRCN